MGWTNRQAVALFRTSREVLDVPAFLSHPTALRLASPAQFFAKLGSDKNQAKRSGSSFRADSLQPLCRLFGGPHVRHVRQMDRRQDAGGESAGTVGGRSKAGKRQYSDT